MDGPRHFAQRFQIPRAVIAGGLALVAIATMSAWQLFGSSGVRDDDTLALLMAGEGHGHHALLNRIERAGIDVNVAAPSPMMNPELPDDDGAAAAAPWCTSDRGREVAGNKALASKALRPGGFAPWAMEVDTDMLTSEAACLRGVGRARVPFPVVLKPAVSGGGSNVYTHIETTAQFCTTVHKLVGVARSKHGFLKDSYDASILAEQMVQGENYRILVFRGRVIDVIHRGLPFVVGDGRATLKELVAARNAVQKKTPDRWPTRPNSVIYGTIRERHNLTPSSVVPKGTRIDITDVANLHNGANIVHVPRTRVHPSHIKRCTEALRVLGVAMAGLDYMTRDLSDPDAPGFVIDVNTSPGTTASLTADFPGADTESWFGMKPGFAKGDLNRLIPCYARASSGVMRHCYCHSHKDQFDHGQKRDHAATPTDKNAFREAVGGGR